MKNFIADLLIKLAKKEEETKELILQVKTLEIVVSGLVQNLEQNQRLKFISSVEASLESVPHGVPVGSCDSCELNKNLTRLLLNQRD